MENQLPRTNETKGLLPMGETPSKVPTPSRFRTFSGPLAGVEWILLIGIPVAGIIAILDVFLYLGVPVYTEQYLAAIIGLTFGAVFLKVPATAKSPRDRLPWYDAVLSVCGVVVGFYVVINFHEIALTIGLMPWNRIVLGFLAIGITLETCRRMTGWPLVVIVVFFLFYAHFSYLFPGPLYARGTPWSRLAIYLYLDNNALTGIPLRVTGTIVLAFVIFGRFLFATGGGKFLSDIAMSVMGGYRGGAAKVAVVASSFFGTLSGSAVANVATTGSVTIPLMKRIGYHPYFSAAVEATASSGGQIMPPVMGAAAFLMAELLGIPYVEVVLAALVPAILYYVSVFTQVDLRAAKLGLEGLPRESLPKMGQVLKDGWVFFLPLVVLIYALFVLFAEPDDAGLYSTALLIIICLFLPSRRLSLAKFLNITRTIGEGLLEVLVVAAAAGLLIGVITVTGLGFSFSLALVEISGGSFFLLLILAAAGAILLGMGMTVTAAYLLVVILIAPAIQQVGSIPPIAGHMFVFYFAVLSFLTPPVCLAVYTAASIAECNSMQTAVQSMRLAVAAYLVPFAFAYSPEILFIGSPLIILIVIALCIMGIFMISVGLEAYLLKSLGIPERLVAILAGVGMLSPFWWGRISGLALAVVLLGINFSLLKKNLLSSSD